MQTVWGDDDRYVKTYWNTIPGKLIYSTFDWGIKDKDGYYFILGRTDDVINVAGHRLGTREIEESISSHANISEVAVVGIEDKLKGASCHWFCNSKGCVERCQFGSGANEDRRLATGRGGKARTRLHCDGFT
jgi:acyl-coenzyme A synthetase/AMP-(fatty) acid ligase